MDASADGSNLSAEGEERAPLKIVLADDHPVVRSALRMLLEAEPDFRVVAEAGDVDSALRYVRPHRPDVLILDLYMPGAPSLPAIARVHELSPTTRVLILTMEHDLGFARQAMQADASGYIVKDATATATLVRYALDHDLLEPAVSA